MSLVNLYSIYSCNKVGNVKNINISNKIQDENILIWKQDSMGCKKIRNIELGKKLFDDYIINNINETNLYEVFGKPNKILYENKEKTYILFLNRFSVKL